MLKFSVLTRTRYLLLAVLALSAAAACPVSRAATSDGLRWYGYVEELAIAGRPYTYTPMFLNPSRRTLTFSIVNKPSWATLNTRTGQLSGTPSNTIKSYYTYYNISIAVTDGVSTARTPYFFIRVYPPKTADKPLISGTPAASVTAGTPYAFQPTSRDTFSQPLYFSVKNKPAWASFSVATGRLYGTPAKAQAGTYGNVVISATNGELANALPAFSITVKNGVTTTSTGSATLHWVVPTENTNGTAVTNLAGIRIYYGTSAANLNQVAQVASTSQTSYTVSNLAAGVWYFASRAYTTTGVQSALSSVVSKTIP
jgi:hypothetical protein